MDMFSEEQLEHADSSTRIEQADTNIDGFYIPAVGERISKYTVEKIYGCGAFACVALAMEQDPQHLEHAWSKNKRLKVEKADSSNGKKGASEQEIKYDEMDQSDKPEKVAIKIIRQNEMITNQAKKEIEILRHIAATASCSFIIKLNESFEYKKHLCLVFEALNMNFRQLLNTFGANKGINIAAIKIYTKQLLAALTACHRAGVVHADIKPDNILINEALNHVKLADFGAAYKSDECKEACSGYIGSRYYRAPEVIIGSEWGSPVDVWSLAVSLFEVVTGCVCFEGDNNNDMLFLILQTKGPFPNSFIKSGAQARRHFDFDNCYAFIKHDWNTISGTCILRNIVIERPTNTIRAKLKLNDSSKIELIRFADFLEHCLIVNPKKRLTPQTAFLHSFLQSK